jgi:hypothetical protein
VKSLPISEEFLKPHQFTEHLTDGSKKGILTDTKHLTMLIRLAKGKFKYKKLQERISLSHISFLFRKNHFLFDVFDKKLSQMIESGLAEKIVNEFESPFPPLKEDSEPVVLSLHHLGTGFLICLLFLLASFVVFVLEVCFESTWKRIR